MVTGLTAWGEPAPSAEIQTSVSIDVAVAYNPLIANVASGNSFSMQGERAQVHGQFWRGLGVGADVSGLHTASTGGSSGLDLVTVTFGPRYTWSPARRRYAVFGQALVGEANGMNSVFPNPAGANKSANSLALYVGGGVTLRLKGRLALRAFQSDWLRTQLPNATTNVQNNLRVGAGLIYRFK